MPALHSSTRRAARLFAALWSTLLLATIQPVSAAPGKVATDPSPVTMPEGTATSITVTLSEPIIAPTPDPEVVVDLTIGDPARVALSTSQLVFAATDWQTPQTLTVTALDNATHDLTPAVTVTGVVSSASEYYAGYRVTITVNIVDNDPIPTTTTPPSTTTPAVATTQPAATLSPAAPAPTTEVASGDDPPEPAPTRPSSQASPKPATAPPSSTTTTTVTSTTATATTTTTTPDAPAIGAGPPSTPTDPEVAAARTTPRSDSPVSIWVLVTAAVAAAGGGSSLLIRRRNRRSDPPRTP